MGLIEIVLLIAMVLLGILVIKSDITEGKVYNKTLLLFFSVGSALDIIYYGIFCRDLVIPFVLNLFMVIVASLVLFYAKCFAGGDCKLLIVMAVLYPANFYVLYGRSLNTLVFAIGISAFYGYLFLLGTSLFSLITRKSKINISYVRNYVMTFINSFIITMIYISAMLLMLSTVEIRGVTIPVWLTRAMCIILSWITGRYVIFRKKMVLVVVVIIDLVLSVSLKIIPFSLHPENYILVIALLVCQMTIRTSIYEEISIEDLKQGMILTMGSSALMQNSKVRGLPKVSMENLNDRLSSDEVASVKRWAKYRKVETVAVVKKIPFATFIILGFISYWFVWGILSW